MKSSRAPDRRGEERQVRVVRPAAYQDDDEELELEYVDVDDTPNELIVALKDRMLSLFRMQLDGRLPFLPRNLRKGLKLKGIDANPMSVTADTANPRDHVVRELRISFRCGAQSYSQYDHLVTVADWPCPLCFLFGGFRTFDMLNKHVKRLHKNISLEWIEGTSEVCPRLCDEEQY